MGRCGGPDAAWLLVSAINVAIRGHGRQQARPGERAAACLQRSHDGRSAACMLHVRSVAAAEWQHLLDAIPEDLLSRAEKHAVEARILMQKATPEERFALFRGGHDDAAERLRTLLQLPGEDAGEGGGGSQLDRAS